MEQAQFQTIKQLEEQEDQARLEAFITRMTRRHEVYIRHMEAGRRPAVVTPTRVHAPSLIAPHDDSASSSSAHVALPVGMENNPSEAFGYELDPDMVISFQGPHDDSTSSSFAHSALVPVGMEFNPFNGVLGCELPDSAIYSFDYFLNQGYTYTTSSGNNSWGQNQNFRNFLESLGASAVHVVTGSSGGRRGRNRVSDILPAYGLEAGQRFCNDLARAQAHRAAANLLDADYDDLEAGRQGNWGAHLQLVVAAVTLSAGGARRTGSGATAPVPEPSEAANTLEGVMVQSFAALLPACVTAYSLLKDAADYVKFTIFGVLVFTTICLFAGILSRSVARRRLAIRLVSLSAISVLTFSVASQLSGPTYIALTAFVGVVANLLLMLLRFS